MRAPELRLSVARQNDQNSTAGERKPFMTPDDIAVVKDVVKTAALCVGAVMVINKMIDAACEIAVAHGTPQ